MNTNRRPNKDLIIRQRGKNALVHQRISRGDDGMDREMMLPFTSALSLILVFLIVFRTDHVQWSILMPWVGLVSWPAVCLFTYKIRKLLNTEDRTDV